MSRWSSITAVCLCLFAALAVAACGSDSSDSSSSSEAAQEPAAETTEPAAATTEGESSSSSSAIATGGGKDTSGSTIGVLSLAPISDIQTLVEQFEKGCAKDNNWSVKVVNANGDPATAQNGISQFNSSGIDAIYNIGFEYTALERQAQESADKGIPFVSAFASAPPGTLHFDPLNWEGAVNEAQYLVDSMGGEGTVGLISSKTGSAVIRIREQALEAVLQNYPDIKIVARHELNLANPIPDSISATQSMLQSNSELDAIWAAYDDPAIGAIQAINQAGRQDEVKVFSFNAQPNMLEQLREEGSPAWASTYVDLNAGTEAVCFLLKESLAGAKIVQPNLYVKGSLITRDNVPAGDEPPGNPVFTLSNGDVVLGK